MPTISLVINTRDEAHNLEGLLDSAAGVDEVIVADMESTDRTVEIARRRGARVLTLPNAGYCEPGRQPAIDAARSDWVLVLDADERLPGGAIERLRSLAGTTPISTSAFSLVRQVFLGATRLFQTGWDASNERQVRLFRRGCVSWPAAIHCAPLVRGDTVAIAEDDVWIVHYNFVDLAQAIAKINRYSSIEARERLAANHDAALLPGLREAVDEFIRRYSPVEDGALSFALSFGIFAYRVLVRTKAAEALGWPADAIPSQSALCRGLEAFWTEVSRETISARPAGAQTASAQLAPEGARATAEQGQQ